MPERIWPSMMGAKKEVFEQLKVAKSQSKNKVDPLGDVGKAKDYKIVSSNDLKARDEENLDPDPAQILDQYKVANKFHSYPVKK